MKKTIVIFTLMGAILFTLLPSKSMAETHFGLRGGLNLATFSGDDAENMEYKFGFIGGGYMKLLFSQSLGIQPEILFSQRGAKLSGEFLGINTEATFTMNYLAVPFQFLYTIDDVLNFYAGPGVAFYLNGSVKSNYSGEILNFQFDSSGKSDISKDNVKSPAWFWTAGVGYNSGPLQVDFCYTRGFDNFYTFSDNEINMVHSELQMIVGYLFNVSSY